MCKLLVKTSGLSEGEAREIILKLKKYLEQVPDPKGYVVFSGRKGNFRALVTKNRQGVFKLSSNDAHTLERLLSGKGFPVSEKPVVWIDDAGGGCPIGGVLIGVFEEKTGRFLFREIPVKFFQGKNMREKAFLREIADAAAGLLEELGVSPNSARIQVCSGHLNTLAKERLRELGFEVDMSCPIGDPLQSLIENAHLAYLKEKFGFHAPPNADYRKLNLAAGSWLRQKKERRALAKDTSY